jgi:acyl carrier protein
MTAMDCNTTDEEILEHIKRIFVENFDVQEADITLGSDLNDDLDIDSIDAVDLMVELKKSMGTKLDPDAFKLVRTVGDVVDAVHALLAR